MNFLKYKSLSYLLNKEQKKEIKIIVLILIISVILETFGISLIIPLISLVVSPEKMFAVIENISFLEFLLVYDSLTLLKFVTITLISLYTFKAILLTYFTKKYLNFGYNLQVYLSEKLLWEYLRSPYKFHVNSNSSDLIRNLNIEISNLCKGYIFSTIQLISESFVTISIIILLFVVQPLAIFVLILYFSAIIIPYLLIIRNKNKFWGFNRTFYEEKQIKDLQSCFSGIRDIIINNAKNFFANNYLKHTILKIQNNRNQDFALSLPRLWLEQISVLCLGLYILLSIYLGIDLNLILPILALTCAAAFRVLPSLNRIINSYQGFKFYSPIIDLIYNEFKKLSSINSEIKKFKQIDEKNFKFEKKIEFKNVSFGYNSQNIILDKVSTIISKGEKIGIKGGSGAGKSTLLDLLMGLIEPNSGSINVDDFAFQKNLKSWHNLIGYVPQTIFFNDNTISENIAYGHNENNIDKKKIYKIIEILNLKNFINSLESGIDTKIGEFGAKISGGQRQRLGIARALYKDPKILILDEATNSLDKENENIILKTLHENFKDLTIIVVAHNYSAFKYCDKIFQLENRSLIEIKE